MEDIKYTIRYATTHDMNYVFSSWRKSLKAKTKRYRKYLPWGMYNQWFQSYAQNRLNQGYKILIACNPEDLEQIYSFIIYRPQSPPIIEYLYTKSIYQGLGIARALLKRTGIKDNKILTTTITDEIKPNKYNIVYLPLPEEYHV